MGDIRAPEATLRETSNTSRDVTEVRLFSPVSDVTLRPASVAPSLPSAVTEPVEEEVTFLHSQEPVIEGGSRSLGAIPFHSEKPWEPCVSDAEGLHTGLNAEGNDNLYAVVWQYTGASWAELYHFNTGLEFDCLSTRPSASIWSRLHLPSTSLKALQRLRAALHLPKAIWLDSCTGTSRSSVITSLCEQAAGMLDATGDSTCSNSEIRSVLEARASATASSSGTFEVIEEAPQDDDVASVHSEVLVEPLGGTEAVDISVCPLMQASQAMPPAVVITRLVNPVSLRPDGFGHSRTPPARFVAVVFCSMRSKRCTQLGREIARGLAIAFMDEEFARTARTSKHPQLLLDFLDSFLSTLTLVPTVYMMAASPSRMPTDDMITAFETLSEVQLDYMLTDSMVDSIERRIRKGRQLPPATQDSGAKLHYCRHDRDRHPWHCRRRYFVEVHENRQSTHSWFVSQRLWQGLRVQIDVETGAETPPQLPLVSEHALESLRQLFKPESIGLDVASANVQAMIDAVLHQLSKAGLNPGHAAEEVAEKLQQWFATNQHSVEQTEAVRDAAAAYEEEVEPISPQLSAGSKQLPPRPGDEACHIIMVVGSKLPKSHSVVGAFLRFASPLESGFSPTGSNAGSLARFLLVLVAPEKAREELGYLREALSALAVDEDLMGDLTLAESGQAFCAAIDLRLADLTVVSRTQLNRTKATLKRYSCQVQKHLSSNSAQQARVSTNSAETVYTELVKQTTVENKTVASSDTPDVDNSSKGVACKQHMKYFVSKLQKYSIPLVTGVTLAMFWENVHSSSYHEFTHNALWDGAQIVGHDLSLHFIVNDIFMCFFFGLAIKEVTEALLPGGSLNPLSRAINPLFATAGGIFVPVAFYCVLILIFDAAGTFDDTMCQVPIDDVRRLGGSASAETGNFKTELCPLETLMKGWGVPTATDISLAWMFALLVFGAGHPCINFLLLLAIVDDAIGMIIIAVFYPNPEKPVEPLWLLLFVGGIGVAGVLRYFHFEHWQVYVCVAGPIAWLGLIKAHVHPALALCGVVPLMPANVARRRMSADDRHMSFRWSRIDLMRQMTFNNLPVMHGSPSDKSEAVEKTAMLIAQQFGDVSAEQRARAAKKASMLMKKAAHAPLHAFEHVMKLPVDMGMFFFGLANAGVKLGSVGGVTYSVVAALFAGKTLGIAGFGLFAQCLGFDLPAGIGVGDLFAASALGGVGLTVALFVANQAFTDKGLQNEAKMGAVISVLCAALAWVIQFFFGGAKGVDATPVVECHLPPEEHAGRGSESFTSAESTATALTEIDTHDDGDDFVEETLIDDILQTFWQQRHYSKRGSTMPVVHNRRSMSKEAHGHVRRNSRTSSTNVGFSRRFSNEYDREIDSSLDSAGGMRPTGSQRSSLRLSTKECLGERTISGDTSKHSAWSPGSWMRQISKGSTDGARRPSLTTTPTAAWGEKKETPKASSGPWVATRCMKNESPSHLTLSEVGHASTTAGETPSAISQGSISQNYSPRMLD